MASPTKTVTALVLRRTKLGETDVIVTLLAEDGSQVKAVAKGARKPTSSFASRLELYSVAKILVAEGKNLDIVKEVRLLEGNEALRNDFFRSSASAPIVELLAKSTYEDQPTARLFALSRAALHSIANTPNDPLVATLAGLLKALAFLGFRPSFTECVGCGDTPELAEGTRQTFSFFDGGVVCARCATHHETTLVSAGVLQWCNTLVYSTFQEIEAYHVPAGVLEEALVFTNEWIHLHLGISMKSLAFLFKNVFNSSI